MRAAVILFALGACTPEIASGVYLCGENSACPEDQVCNGPDNTCVAPGVVQAFACDPGDLHEPDQDVAHGFQLPALDCVSALLSTQGCLANGDSQNWVVFDVPTTCSAVEVQASLTFPIGFEALELQVGDDTGAILGSDTACTGLPSSDVSGSGNRCIKVPLTPGGHFGVGVVPTGEDNCDGGCSFNRYLLKVQLATPG